jgi:hypothetical protein
MHQDQPRAMPRGKTQIVQRHQHRATLFCQAREHLHRRDLLRRIKPGNRLVSQKQGRLLRQCAGNQDSALLSTRKLRGDTMPEPVQPKTVKRVVDRRTIHRTRLCAARQMRHPAQRHQRFHLHRPGNLARLRQKRRRPRSCDRVQPRQARGAAERLQPQGRAHQRRLSSAVGTDQTDTFPGTDRQGYMIDHRTFPAPDGQVFKGQQGHLSSPRVL